MAAMDEAVDWARGLDEVVERIAPCFRRIEPRRRVRAYLQGLLWSGGAQERLAIGRACWRPHARRGAGLSRPHALGCRSGAR